MDSEKFWQIPFNKGLELLKQSNLWMAGIHEGLETTVAEELRDEATVSFFEDEKGETMITMVFPHNGKWALAKAEVPIPFFVVYAELEEADKPKLNVLMH